MLRIFLIIIGFISFGAKAQNVVQAKVLDGKAFIGHRVGVGETLFGIGHSYGISPKDLASFNGLNPQKGLEKNIVLKIPITPATISIKNCNNCATIKYAVQQHEGLYRIGLNFGNIGMQNLYKLNSLTSDNLSTGQELVVGYMKATGNEVSMVDNSTQIEKTIPNIDVTPVVTTKEATVTKQPIVVKNNSSKEAAVPKKQEPVTTQTLPAPTEKKQDLPPVITNENASITNADGAFAGQFNNKFAQNKNGTAGIFKSISGWQDKKYYALMNSVEAGTILRISNATTGKSIYAKVLGQMPNIKGSDNLLLRISDAGVAALGANEETMQVTIVY